MMKIKKLSSSKAKREKMNKKILLAVLCLVLAGAIGIFAYRVNSDGSEVPDLVGLTENEADNQNQSESGGEIEFSKDGKVVTCMGSEGKTALEVLKSLTSVKYTNTDFGVLVTAINGVEAERGKAFWDFYINGQKAADEDYVTDNEDVLEWRLESF